MPVFRDAPELFRLEDGLKPDFFVRVAGQVGAPELFRLEDGLKPNCWAYAGRPTYAPELFRLEDGLKPAAGHARQHDDKRLLSYSD